MREINAHRYYFRQDFEYDGADLAFEKLEWESCLKRK